MDSTNAHGFGLPDLPAWVVAEEQTAGRGRRGREWASPRGNFYGSLILAPEGPAEQRGLLSFVAALALRDALIAVTGLPRRLSLKWPNDVLLNGGKLSGILLEARGDRLAIGIGVNLIGAPSASEVEPGAFPPVSLLAETGMRITPDQLLAHLAPAMAARQAQLQHGFAGTRSDFLAHAARQGQRIVARTMTATYEGVFRTIDETGALILDTDAGPVPIPAADIFFSERPHASGH